MFGGTLSPLTENLIVISLVGVTALIGIGIARFALLKSAKAVAETETGVNDSSEEKRIKKISAVAKILSYAVVAATLITLLVFALFVNTGNQSAPSEAVKIPTAPLPPDFKPPTDEEIRESNETAVNRKSAEVAKQAMRENDEAMKKGVELFKKAK